MLCRTQHRPPICMAQCPPGDPNGRTAHRRPLSNSRSPWWTSGRDNMAASSCTYWWPSSPSLAWPLCAMSTLWPVWTGCARVRPRLLDYPLSISVSNLLLLRFLQSSSCRRMWRVPRSWLRAVRHPNWPPLSLVSSLPRMILALVASSVPPSLTSCLSYRFVPSALAPSASWTGGPWCAIASSIVCPYWSCWSLSSMMSSHA